MALPKTMKITAYADPGHAWAKVSMKLLRTLGIEDKVTPYSYRRGEFAYLEEDCDMDLIVKALQDRGVVVSFRESHSNKSSKIRSYRPYYTGVGLR